VTVFEAAEFPRHHVGESTIPSLRTYLQFIGAEDKIEGHGFYKEPGAAMKFTQNKKEGYTDFLTPGPENYAWNVVRSKLDELLLNHARDCGAQVFERTTVDAIAYSEDTGKPISATWTHTPSEEGTDAVTGTTFFDFVVDATGRAGLISTKFLKNRRFNASLKNMAMWGYWTGTGRYGVGTDRENAPWYEALADNSGWAWFIPLHNGQTSVGLIMNQESFARGAETEQSLVARYQTHLHLAPNLVKLIGDGTLVVKPGEPIVRSAEDFSYQADRYAGDGYRIAGDAGAFIDPFFSSGVHLAFTSALSAAATIAASIRGDCTESEAADWHTTRFTTNYTRYELIVLSAYKQLGAPPSSIVSDSERQEFDKGFSFLVIQGATENGNSISEDDVQHSLEFCTNIIRGPPVPEKNGEEGPAGLTPEASAPSVPQVAEDFSTNNVELEAVNGFSMKFAKGKLGLQKV
jgi:flavin-dependent dehydrogenase